MVGQILLNLQKNFALILALFFCRLSFKKSKTMATENNHKNQTIDETPNGGAQGRTHNSQDPKDDNAADLADISAVDQQEGNMNHGEVGDDSLTGDHGPTSGERPA